MKTMRSFLPGFCYSPISLLAYVALFALFSLAWATSAFCGEIHEAAADCEIARVQSLLKAHSDLVSSSIIPNFKQSLSHRKTGSPNWI